MRDHEVLLEYRDYFEGLVQVFTLDEPSVGLLVTLLEEPLRGDSSSETVR